MPPERKSPAPLAGDGRANDFPKLNGALDSTAAATRATAAGELRDLARAVRRIGTGWRDDPETIALAKDGIATRLTVIARQFERGAP